MADLNIGNSTANVIVNAKHNGTVNPQINNTYDLGTSDLRWKNIYGNLKGNADTATKLATAKTISLTGSVTGSGTFDGSGNLSIATTTNHTHSYAGSASAGGPANSVKTNLIIKLNGGTTEGTNLFTFNGSTAKTINITSSAIGASASGHTHAVATTSANGFMSSDDKAKLDGIATGANKYTHPTYTAKSAGFYKVTVDGTGHVSATTAVTKADITGLGIPGSDTWRGIQNNLTSTSTTDSLSAAQGKILNETKAVNKTLTNEDLNTVTTPGFYNAGGGNSVINKPSGVNHFGLIVVHNASGTYYTQNIFNDSGEWKRTCINGTWGSWTNVTVQTAVPANAKFTDTVYTHPTTSGNKHIPSGGSAGQILRWSADGTAAWGADNNTTYSANTGIKLNGTTFQHTNSVTAGTAQGDASKTLTFGGTFTIPTVTYDAQGHITGKGTTTMTMPANPNTDTHWTTGITAGETGTTSNSATTNGNTFIKIKDNSTHRGQIKLIGSGATSVSSNAEGVITISSTDNNTTYGSMSVSEGTTGTATTNRVLTAANLKGIINAHAPTKTGGGASGTWGISIGGNAATATKATQDGNGKVIATEYVHKTNSSSTLNQFSGAPKYLLGIEAFADGGEVKWQGVSDIKVGSADTASKVNNKLTVGSKTYDGSAAVTIEASDLGLASAMLFLGTTTTAITDGATTNPVTIGGSNKTVTAGNVVLYGSKEFVWTGSAWEELGNEGSYKIVQAAVADPSASGTSNTFIDTISQDTNGKITATKKTVAVTNSAPTLAWNTTSTIGTIAGTNLQVKMPANPNTDTKVTQTVTTSNAAYPLLLAPNGQTATTTTTSYFDSGVTLNPSTNTIEANISGNAETATKLATARTIQTNLASTSSASFNGTANITPGVTGTLPIANGGTGATTANAARDNLGAQSKVLYGDSEPSDTIGTNGDLYVALYNDRIKQDIVDLIYPVGSIYISMNSTNPSTLFGGTWEAFGQGRVLIGAGTGNDGSTSLSFTANSIGGEYYHSLSISELPNISGEVKTYNCEYPWDGGIFHSISGIFKNGETSNTAIGRPNRESQDPSAGITSFNSFSMSFGNNQQHNNMMPYISTYMWKRTA